VSITATGQDFDYYSPWKRGRVSKRFLTGCVLGGERIVTLSRPLANHILVEVSKFGSSRKYPAEVLLKDYNCGLAFLTVKDKSFFSDLQPVELAASERPRGRAVVARWDPEGNLKAYNAEAFNTSIEFYGACGAVLLHHMTTGLDSGGNGEPVFVARPAQTRLSGASQLLGVTLYFDKDRRTIKVCAADNIKRVLQDLDDGKYGGMPFFVVGHVGLNSDENLREYLGLGPSETGILVTSVPPKTSGHDVLKKNDVILSIDGVAIDDRGLYDSGVYGKLNFYGLLSLKHSVGDKVTMNIIREKKKMDVSFDLAPMTSECYLIPLLDLDTPPQYYVYGGIVFQELTEGYVNAWGKEVDRRLLFLFETLKLMPSLQKRRCVILNRVLPASVNVGYHDKKNLVLAAVNGNPLRDLKHFKEIVETPQDQFLRFQFEGGDNIVLDRQWVAETNDSILKRYNVPAQSYMALEQRTPNIEH
jgi:hypothetical protein